VRDKNSDEVQTFLALFGKLKEWIDDRPTELFNLAREDDGVRDLSDRLYWVAQNLREAERRGTTQFAHPVDPNFVVAWRDYESRFEENVSDVMWFGTLPELLQELRGEEVPHGPAHIWDMADSAAETEARTIELALNFAGDQLDPDRDFLGEFADELEDGLRAWRRLRQDWGFDLQGVFRRRQLVPFVLIPRQVAARITETDRLSLAARLKQAQDAFVFGVPWAAIALMRSITETVLTDHYGAHQEELIDKIDAISSLLPRAANRNALHRLRSTANTILHPKPQAKTLREQSVAELEMELVSLLGVVRALIEGAPGKGR